MAIAAPIAAGLSLPSLASAEISALHFVDIADSAGVRDSTWAGRSEKPHLLESAGSGPALFDYDADGDLDLYVVNGWRLLGATVVERGRNILYRNDGAGSFVDVSRDAGVDDDGWGSGVAIGDIDGDQDLDLFVANFGPDVLYRNNGDGTFAAVPDAPGIDGWSAAPVFFDSDRDGDVDLYVCAYVDCTLDDVLHAQPSLVWHDTKVMLGPFGLEGEANRFFENSGDGTFHEATEVAGLTDAGLYYSFAVAAVDLDLDLDLDIYVANDSNPNYIYANDGAGRFEEEGLWSGAALDRKGVAQAGMGLALGDVDGNLLPDVFVSNFANDQCTLYLNLGHLLFEDATKELGLFEVTYAPLSWGTAFADFDLDGDLDLFVANGHIYPQADHTPAAKTSYRQTNLLLEFRDDRFVDVSAAAGSGMAIAASSRGTAVGDIDADGDLDLVVTNIDAPPNVLRNDSSPRGAWLMVGAPGAARVVVDCGDRRLTRDFVAGGSYASVSDWRFHFGLGDVERVDQVTVIWFDGAESVRRGVDANQILMISRDRP